MISHLYYDKTRDIYSWAQLSRAITPIAWPPIACHVSPYQMTHVPSPTPKWVQLHQHSFGWQFRSNLIGNLTLYLDGEMDDEASFFLAWREWGICLSYGIQLSKISPSTSVALIEGMSNDRIPMVEYWLFRLHEIGESIKQILPVNSTQKKCSRV